MANRTDNQNKALHVFLRELAQTLNNAGLDQRAVFDQMRLGVDMPWNEITVKENLWRPIQKALTQKNSTTEINTLQPSEVHQVLSKFCADRLQIVCPPWPDARGL